MDFIQEAGNVDSLGATRIDLDAMIRRQREELKQIYLALRRKKLEYQSKLFKARNKYKKDRYSLRLNFNKCRLFIKEGKQLLDPDASYHKLQDPSCESFVLTPEEYERLRKKKRWERKAAKANGEDVLLEMKDSEVEAVLAQVREAAQVQTRLKMQRRRKKKSNQKKEAKKEQKEKDKVAKKEAKEKGDLKQYKAAKKEAKREEKAAAKEAKKAGKSTKRELRYLACRYSEE